MNPFKQKTLIQIRFKDIDKLGHVNNANHITYFELARVEYFSALAGSSANHTKPFIIEWNNEGVILAKIEMEYFAKQDKVYAADNTETPTPGYLLYNAGVGADITNSHGKVLVNINIQGNNITDVAYQSHLSRLKYFEPYPNKLSGKNGIYNMGRNISLKLIMPLNF